MTSVVSISQPNTRRVAWNVVLGIQGGVFSSDLLARETAKWTPAGFAEEIAFCVLRRSAIGFLIEQAIRPPNTKLDPEAFAALSARLRFSEARPPGFHLWQSASALMHGSGEERSRAPT